MDAVHKLAFIFLRVLMIPDSTLQQTFHLLNYLPFHSTPRTSTSIESQQFCLSILVDAFCARNVVNFILSISYLFNHSLMAMGHVCMFLYQHVHWILSKQNRSEYFFRLLVLK